MSGFHIVTLNSEIVDIDIPLAGLPELQPYSFEKDTDIRAKLAEKSQQGAIDTKELIKRTRKAMGRGLPSVGMLRRYTTPNREAVICGGGPSLKDELPRLRALHARGVPIYTVNKTHDYLISEGIPPYAQVLLDPNEWVKDYTKPVKGVRYLIAGQCHDETFKALEGFNCFLWHGATNSEDGRQQPIGVLEDEFKRVEWVAHPGPTTVGLRAILVANGIHRSTHMHLFGFDSSKAWGKLHAYPKAERADVPQSAVKIKTADGREDVFNTNMHMLMQVTEFEKLVEEQIPNLARKGAMDWLRFTIYGSGLLPTLGAMYGWHADQAMNEKWKKREAA